MNYLRDQIIRCHHGLSPIRFAHCNNQARVVDTPHVLSIEGMTFDGLIYGNLRLHDRYGDPNVCTFFRNNNRLQPLWSRIGGGS